MKAFKLVAIFCVVALFFTACQKEIVFSTNGTSIGTLKEATTGNCLPSTVNGVFQKDTAISSDNFIDVNVDVTSVGTYSIATDTVNGVSFKGTGTFGARGNNRVRLYGYGKPTATGISTFTVIYGASICTIDVTVIGSGGGSAIYTLGGAGSTCSGFTLGAGTYNAGQILVAGNTATLNVSVLAVGSYDLTTDTVNGIFFNAKDIFTNATVQSLTLNGHGTPLANGTYTYHLTNGNTTCTFIIVTGAGTTAPTTNGEYIPMTTGSNWSALIANSTPDDTTYTVVSPNTIGYLGNTYHIFESQIMGVPNDSSFFRKVGTSKYYEYAVDDFGVLDNPYILDFMVLDSSQGAGYTWVVNLGPNTAAAGTIVITSAELDGKILEKGSTQTVAGITYNNVYRVQYVYKATPIIGGAITVATEERWYAKGYGLIMDKITEQYPTTTAPVIINTTRIQIF